MLALAVAGALIVHPATRASSLVGLGIVAAGLPAYALLRRA